MYLNCNTENKKSEKQCNLSEIEDFELLKWSDSFEDVGSLTSKLFTYTQFDTLYIFLPYTTKDTIRHYIKCYDEKLDTITYEDQYYLVLLNKEGNLKYKYLKRGNLLIKENVIFPAQSLQAKGDKIEIPL